MTENDTIDNIEDIERSLNERRPVFVDAMGEIHDAEKPSHDAEKPSESQVEDEHGPGTLLKATTWYSAAT